jgi:hypothetical protein
MNQGWMGNKLCTALSVYWSHDLGGLFTVIHAVIVAGHAAARHQLRDSVQNAAMSRQQGGS